MFEDDGSVELNIGVIEGQLATTVLIDVITFDSNAEGKWGGRGEEKRKREGEKGGEREREEREREGEKGRERKDVLCYSVLCGRICIMYHVLCIYLCIHFHFRFNFYWQGS